MTSSVSDSPNYCTHNLTPSKSSGYEGSYDIAAAAAASNKPAEEECLAPLQGIPFAIPTETVTVAAAGQKVKRRRSSTKSGEKKPKSAGKKSMATQPTLATSLGSVWRLTEEDCLETLPTILGRTEAVTIAGKPTEKVQKRKTSKSEKKPTGKKYRAAKPNEQVIHLPYNTPTENVSVGASSGSGKDAGEDYKPTEEECMAVQPLRSIPLSPETVTVATGGEKCLADILIGPGITLGSIIPTGMKIHQRPAWLPVGWAMWRMIRTSGDTTGHNDTYYYTPDGQVRVRSMKEIFYLLTMSRMPNADDSEYVQEEFEYEVPKEMATWYGPYAGVIVHFTKSDIRVLPGGMLTDNPMGIRQQLPISVKKVKVPAGTRYRNIGDLVKKANLQAAKEEQVQTRQI